MHDRMHADAEKKVRAGILMASIAKKNGFQVTEDDIEKGIQELAVETGKAAAKLKVEYRDANKRQMLIGMILEDKILDFLEGKSKITEGPVPATEEAKEPAKEGPKEAKAGKSAKEGTGTTAKASAAAEK
jgi:trigger factor